LRCTVVQLTGLPGKLLRKACGKLRHHPASVHVIAHSLFNPQFTPCCLVRARFIPGTTPYKPELVATIIMHRPQFSREAHAHCLNHDIGWVILGSVHVAYRLSHAVISIRWAAAPGLSLLGWFTCSHFTRASSTTTAHAIDICHCLHTRRIITQASLANIPLIADQKLSLPDTATFTATVTATTFRRPQQCSALTVVSDGQQTTLRSPSGIIPISSGTYR